MDKITLTSAGATFLQQHFSTPNLPSIARQSSQNHFQTSMMRRQSSNSKLNATSLRSILKDDTISSLNKVKAQTKIKAYNHVKRELMKDIPANKEFLNSKAETMIKKMLSEIPTNQQLQTEISKGKNYLSKLVEEYESQRIEDERLKARLREKVRTLL